MRPVIKHLFPRHPNEFAQKRGATPFLNERKTLSERCSRRPPQARGSRCCPLLAKPRIPTSECSPDAVRLPPRTRRQLPNQSCVTDHDPKTAPVGTTRSTQRNRLDASASCSAVRHHRTHSTIISASKCRPLNRAARSRLVQAEADQIAPTDATLPNFALAARSEAAIRWRRRCGTSISVLDAITGGCFAAQGKIRPPGRQLACH